MPDTPLYIPVLEQRKKFTDYRKDVWGDSYNWSWVRSWDSVKYLVIHHSVTKPTSNSKADVDYIAQLHKNRGWGGIGYHFIITADGIVWYVGDISTARANVADKNDMVIGICLVGDFREYNPTDEQILSASDLCKYLMTDVYALKNVIAKGWDAVVGHKELQATECPGPSWKGTSDSMYERIKNRIPYTPQPQPEPVINWEKRYKDLSVDFDKAKISWEDEKQALLSAKTESERILAEHKVDCQREIAELKQKLENANSVNPKIPSIEEYDDDKVIARALDIIVTRIKNKIPIFFKKQES